MSVTQRLMGLDTSFLAGGAVLGEYGIFGMLPIWQAKAADRGRGQLIARIKILVPVLNDLLPVLPRC